MGRLYNVRILRREPRRMKRCNYCFDEYQDGFDVCPYCGYIDGDGAQELYHLYPGTILNGRYIVGQVLGFGGFGITYKVWDTNLKTVWAIKEYYPSGLVNRTPGTKDVNVFSGNRLKIYNHGLMRFLDEARSMAKFSSHKNIINVIEYFEENNTAYIVMEYLDGTTLSEFLKSNRMDVESSIEVISHICSALKDVHKMGFIHRDVSPDNIFLCTNGVVKLIDFGAARFSSDEEQQRTIILKPGFAPPEQYEKVNIQGSWTDIYAVGATLYYMITGVKPEESTNRKIADNLLAPHKVDETIPEYIGNTVMQAMAIDKHMRFANIIDFEKGLNQEVEVLPIDDQIKRRKRRRFMGLAAAFLIVAISSSLFYFNWDRQRQAETLPDASISIAFFITGNSDFDNARETAFAGIIEAFQDSFPNVDIHMRPYPIAEYEAIIRDAIASGNSPTLFESTGLGVDVLRNTLDLNRVANQLPIRELYFLHQYSAHFPARNQLPLGFNAPVLFVNTVLSDFVGTGWNEGDFNALTMSNLSDEIAFVVYGVDNDARELFTTGRATAYFSKTSAFFDVQRTLPARYRLVYISSANPTARFTDLWSISQHTSANERAAAERFLIYMLSDHAQDLLHIRNNSGNLPINRYVLGVFSQVYNDFDGFFNNVESYVFVPAVKPFFTQIGSVASTDNENEGYHAETVPSIENETVPIFDIPVTASGDMPFTDIDGHWGYDGVRFVFERGLMSGTTPTTFSPNTHITRAAVVMILYRVAGEPGITYRPVFNDVLAGTWFSDPVAWAYVNNISRGVGSGRFDPDGTLVREQLIVMLYRFAEAHNICVEVSEQTTLATATDAGQVSSWAEVGMLWAVDRGLITGTDGGLLNPQRTVTRAEYVTILMRLLESL